ncbi:unnamed protein product [Arctogadus glacialis]
MPVQAVSVPSSVNPGSAVDPRPAPPPSSTAILYVKPSGYKDYFLPLCGKNRAGAWGFGGGGVVPSIVVLHLGSSFTLFKPHTFKLEHLNRQTVPVYRELKVCEEARQAKEASTARWTFLTLFLTSIPVRIKSQDYFSTL